jgi:sigma-B regulation protein RsbU (phosphoserine phosphatase)
VTTTDDGGADTVRGKGQGVGSVLTSVEGAPALLQALPDAVVVADADGDIVYTNPAVSTLLGHDPAALVGQPLIGLMPERFRTAHLAGFGRFLATGDGELIGVSTQVPALHADGHEVPVDLTLSPLQAATDEGPVRGVVIGVLRDASSTVRLEQQLQVSRYLAAILRVTTQLTEAPDADVAFERLLPTLCDQLDWDAASLWQPDGEQLSYAGTWTAPGEHADALHADTLGRRFAPGVGVPGLVWRERAPVVVADLWSDPRFLRADAARADGVRTGVAFPVLQGTTTLAVIELFSRVSRPVPPELVQVLAAAGRQIGQFLGRLRAESQVRRMAETLQRSLLPSSLPTVPGVQVAARYRPGGEHSVVGGDTYDVMPLPDGSWMFLVADVCGTGPEAAASTALTRHTARAVAAGSGPAEILAAVNEALLRETAPDAPGFVTACCILLRPGQPGGFARIALAGHPQPMLRRADGTVTEVGRTGVPLGIEDGASYPEVTVDLGAGDSLLLYTDGVTEARDVDGVQFGESALAELLSVAGGTTATETVAAVHEAVDRHLARSRRPADDLAALALRC